MRALWLVIAMLIAPACAGAQGYAGLGSDAPDGYAEVQPETRLSFPADHAPHPDFRIEWWYVTATLAGPDGADYGIQWTLFRSALAPPPQREGWASQQLWMAHAAASSATAHHSAERFGRGGTGQAGARIGPFAAWLDDWRFESTGNGPDAPFAPLRLTASDARFAYDLTLEADAPMVLQGDQGYSVKSEDGQASHYYSQPFFTVTGTLRLEGREIAVTGHGWMDREWSTQPLSPDQSGWDWFSLRLGPETAVMLYRLRHDDGNHYVTGNWIGADGSSERLGPGEITMTPLGESAVAGRQIPTRWRIDLPDRGVSIETMPLNAESWMTTAFSYWEGPIRFSGSHDGVGYLEMTGY